jgi:hypothetical protein
MMLSNNAAGLFSLMTKPRVSYDWQVADFERRGVLIENALQHGYADGVSFDAHYF